MQTVYIILALILIAIIIFLYRSNIKEGFDNLTIENKFHKESFNKAWNNLNKGLFLNSDLGNELSKITGSFKTGDIFGNNKNGATDYTKYFLLNPLPGLESDNKKCSQVLEPRLLPKHESTTDKGCGWWYVDDINVQSVGAIGYSVGPFDQANLDKTAPGGTWIWDLELAQKKEDDKRCRRITSCEVADLMPGRCGFCVSQGRGIPVNSNGESLYGDDPDFTCSDIVTKPINCPRPEPIVQDGQPPQPVAGLCDPNPATGQLTNDCLITLAKGAGLTDNGAIINILSGDSGGFYADNGSNRLLFLSALNVIKSDSSISSPKEFFGFGPCSRAEALGYYNTIMKISLNGSTKKARSAAKFLAVGSSDFDSCPDDVNMPGPFDISCLERVALEAGCQPDGEDFPKEIKTPPNDAPPYCKRYGRPNDGGTIRLYDQNECNALNGNFYGNGECTKKEGGSFSWDCRELNKLNTGKSSTKDTYDSMKWGDVITYFNNLYTQMQSTDKSKMISATKACLGIDITPLEPDCGDTVGVYSYCYKWDYDYTVAEGKTPQSLYYGRYMNRSMIEFNNNGDYTPLGIGVDRIHLRIKTNLKSNTAQNTQIWVLTDDGIGITVDDKTILQKWQDQAPTQYETSAFTMSDTEPTKIQINWFNNMGGYTFVARIKDKGKYVKIPDSMLFLDQPSRFPFARWDFYEGTVEDRCGILNSEVVGNIPIGVCDGKKCGIFEGSNYIKITNGISTTAFRSISMMVYIRSDHPRWPRLWEFDNTNLGRYVGDETGSGWCQDSIFGCMSPNNGLGIGFYIHENCNGPAGWSQANTVKTGKWHHVVWAIDDSLGAFTMYLDGVVSVRIEDPAIKTILTNKIYKNMYIVNSVEYFSKNVGVAWYRMFDYTMTGEDVATDMNNGWSTATLFPKSSGTGWK